MRKVIVGLVLLFSVFSIALATTNPPLLSVAPPSVSVETTEQMVKNLTDRLVALEIQNYSAIQAQLTQVDERLKLIEGKLGEVEQKTRSYFFEQVYQQIERLKDLMGPTLFMVVALSVLVIFLLLLIYVVMTFRRKTVVSYPNDALPAKDQDFNFMAGQEGATAKLNLARAYLEMGQESKAQGVLYEVLAHGSTAEQAEAKELLEKIKSV